MVIGATIKGTFFLTATVHILYVLVTKSVSDSKLAWVGFRKGLGLEKGLGVPIGLK